MGESPPVMQRKLGGAGRADARPHLTSPPRPALPERSRSSFRTAAAESGGWGCDNGDDRSFQVVPVSVRAAWAPSLLTGSVVGASASLLKVVKASWWRQRPPGADPAPLPSLCRVALG